MVMPRILAACAAASSAFAASFTPPALPRPPACTWALTTTRPPPRRRAIARASAAVVATSPGGTGKPCRRKMSRAILRSEEHTSELQSRGHLVCRLLLEKKKDCYQYFCMPEYATANGRLHFHS